ncbi:copper resistance CopC family protein [Specibacter sp. AOP5-B1-6]|uniref:copper resistance CopC family protein n=1 Tax=Specibacter sp. AOP5-B1-6 TaxID=3457653 RepID=UPI003FB9A305
MKSPVSPRLGETNTTPAKLVRRALAGLLAVLLLLLGSSTAALAHDSITGTSPADGATVESVPEKIEISLSNTPAVIGSQVLVVDEAGTNWAAGDVDVLDKVATQRVRPGSPAGKYTVKWRLVSSDSHPIEGEFHFTATAASTGTAGAGVGAGPVASIQPQSEAAQEPVQDESAVPWSVIGLVAVLLGLVVALVVVARRRLGKED